MQTIKEEGAVKNQCLLLLLKIPKILDQFKGADFKQSVHKRCVVISSPDRQIASIFCCFFQGYRKSSIKSPPGGGLFISSPFKGRA